MEILTPSKQKIINGVTELLREKSLGAIKVADITARSGVSHQTFYRVFADKYDACECACYRLLSAAALVVGENSTVKEQTFCTLNIIPHQRRLLPPPARRRRGRGGRKARPHPPLGDHDKLPLGVAHHELLGLLPPRSGAAAASAPA